MQNVYNKRAFLSVGSCHPFREFMSVLTHTP